MKDVLVSCRPRPELLAGNFNPEVFTLSLAPVVSFYRTGKTTVDQVYTDAKLFFTAATFPTKGLCITLQEVFARLQGDMTVPAIHRLETAFGGGKTHTLIACAHVAFRGKEIADAVRGILREDHLPEPGSVAVAAVCGDEIPVHRVKGAELVPYTLWGEIAYQIGGAHLYNEVQTEVESYAAPGRTYFDKVLGGRKVLIMLDELAQYAARLEAARPDGAKQLAAFLMALHGYARSNPGISVVLTLASTTDAFAKQTEYLAKLISQVTGMEIAKEDALGLGERAVIDIGSVVSRDAVQVIPVHATEISAVLSKRLFEYIDQSTARETALEYMELYRRNSNLLPDEATREDFLERMVATYPFHPTLIDFLNKKLAQAENFQGTRGVLRVLSLAVRDIWLNQRRTPMIHACHLNLRSDRVVNEILGRTGSSDLMFVLNADIGGVDTGTLDTGMSNAELADRENPHPEGYPMHEYTWKTVFLHSLVGRESGLNSRVFGLTEAEALFAVSFPGLSPAQVRMALDKIRETAFYLKFEQGKYYASEEPTINVVLSRIRKTVTRNQVEQLVQETARKLIRGDKLFHVEHDVSQPEDISDGKGRLTLGVVSPVAEEIDVRAIFTTKGPNRPREEQNLVLLLVPETVRVKGEPSQEFLIRGGNSPAEEARRNIEDLARQVKAWRILLDNPLNFGVKPKAVEDDENKKRYAERENALATAVAGIYSGLYYPSSGGQIVKREIKTAGGEGGAPFIEQILEVLKHDKKLLTAENIKEDVLISLSKLFFEQRDTAPLDGLYQNFLRIRSWPVLENAAVFEQIVRAGVQKDVWYVYKLADNNGGIPSELYTPDNPVPMGVSIRENGYGMVTPEGANKRGWIRRAKLDQTALRNAILDTVLQNGRVSVKDIGCTVRNRWGDVSNTDVNDAIVSLVRSGSICVLSSEGPGMDKPALIARDAVGSYVPDKDDILSRPDIVLPGGPSIKTRELVLKGSEGVEVLVPMLKRIGSIFNRGAKTTVDLLDISDLELPQGGTIRIEISKATPGSMKMLGELFEVLGNVARKGDRTDVYLRIVDPDETCIFVKELKSRRE